MSILVVRKRPSSFVVLYFDLNAASSLSNGTPSRRVIEFNMDGSATSSNNRA